METLESMRASRIYTDDIARDAGVEMCGDGKARGYLYFWVDNGAFWIEDYGAGRFSAMVCNGEFVGTLEEAEAYLWENWVRHQVN
jgi:hypothetical protein